MGDSKKPWKDAVLSILDGEISTSTDEKVKVKSLRKLVLLSLQQEDSDKVAKKQFKKVVQGLEEEGELTLDADGMVTRTSQSKKRKAKEDKDSKKRKKKKKKKREETTEEEEDHDDGGAKSEAAAADDDGGPHHSHEVTSKDDPNKSKPCRGNPQGVTRLFLGNLPFAVDEASLEAFLPDAVTHIKWITDKETGKFYGSAFIEMSKSSAAAAGVAMAGTQILGRAIKINFAPSRPGDVWPPPKKVISGGGSGTGGQAGGSGIKAMSAKPENCCKLFIGNLSYEIDDDAITKFFGSVEAEVKAVRWLHHKDSGDFKGVYVTFMDLWLIIWHVVMMDRFPNLCFFLLFSFDNSGFVEFWNTDACTKGAKLNGKNLLGRPIRIDWTD